MAINQQDKALNMASAAISAVEQFMGALETLTSLEAERAASGVNLATFDATYAASTSLRHVDGAALNAVLNTSMPAIKTFMEANNHDDNLQKARP